MDEPLDDIKHGQSIIEFRVLRLEKDQESIRVEFANERMQRKLDMEELKRELIEEIRRQGSGLGKFFDRAMLVIVALISVAALVVGKH